MLDKMESEIEMHYNMIPGFVEEPNQQQPNLCPPKDQLHMENVCEEGTILLGLVNNVPCPPWFILVVC